MLIKYNLQKIIFLIYNCYVRIKNINKNLLNSSLLFIVFVFFSIFLGFYLKNNASAQIPAGCPGGPAGPATEGSCEIYNIQSYLAESNCEAPEDSSADTAERAIEACKTRLKSKAEEIFATCKEKSSDTEVFACWVSEIEIAKETIGDSGFPEEDTTLENTSESLHQADDSESGKFFSYLTIIFTVFSALAGVAMVTSLVVAGIQYATAGDNAGAISKAKSRIVYTLITLLLYVMLFYIVTWLIPSDVIV